MGKKRRGRAIRRSLRGYRLCILLGYLGPLVFHCSAAHAADAFEQRTTYGEVGLLEMPSAHMAPDGELSFTIGGMPSAQHYNAAFQILPWLEGSFRYSRVSKFFNGETLFDRSFGLKARLSAETEEWPDISIGSRDILGTGVYSGEYLVGSKHVSDFDVTLGIGWGRFAQSNALPNPLAQLFGSFGNRPEFNSNAGTVDFGQLFHGPKIGVFGGVAWHSPISGLDVLLEYSSDRYRAEQSGGAISIRSPINVGLSYEVFDRVVASAGWFYGSTFGGSLSISADPTVPLAPVRIAPVVPQPNIRSPAAQANALTALLAANSLKGTKNGPWVTTAEDGDRAQLYAAVFTQSMGVRDAEKVGRTLVVDAHLSGSAQGTCRHFAHVAAGLDGSVDTIALSNDEDPGGFIVFCGVAASRQPQEPLSNDELAGFRSKIEADLAAQNLNVEALSLDGPLLWLYYSNGKYASEDEAAGRVARVLMADAPAGVEIFHEVSVKNGIPLREFELARSALERAAASNETARELGEAIRPRLPALSSPVLDDGQNSSYPRIHWSLGPSLREGFFDPDRPLEVQLLAAADANLEISPHYSLSARVEANIFNNFSFTRQSDSLLPHVRSDALKYFEFGSNGISDLTFQYHNRIATSLYVEAKAGYLEDMFGGAGLQFLWRPEGERFAIGADAYEVWQRNFNRLFGFQDYHVLTGHVSVYYRTPWYGLNVNVHAGRYLAGDYGATIEVLRHFESGVDVGAFATFTNVPFSKFGEGSFDKGIVLHIPFEWALPVFSQASYNLLLRSLSRDGGQRLVQDDSLYDETEPTSFEEVQSHLEDIVSPQ